MVLQTVQACRLDIRFMSLQKRLAKYLMVRPGVKIPKGQLCDLARSCEQKYTGENTGRRLRYLETAYDVKGTPMEEQEHIQARALLMGGRIKVEYGKKHAALYWFEPPHYVPTFEELNRQQLAWFEGLPV
jgi:hypothetical protein